MIVTNLTANGIVSINVANGLQLTTGQFVLVDYEGSIGGGGFDAFVLANLPPGVEAELVNNTANSSIDLNITGAPGLPLDRRRELRLGLLDAELAQPVDRARPRPTPTAC